jgi:hypothetical protein
MELVDSRAETVEEISSENPVQLPEGLTQLSPEEVQAATDATSEEVTAEQQEAMIREAYAKAEAETKALTESLAGIGTYILVRFENPTSMRAVTLFSNPRPQDRTIIGVFERLIRELKAYETRAWVAAADAQDAKEKENEKEGTLTREILKRGLPNNRATRRKLEQELGL